MTLESPSGQDGSAGFTDAPELESGRKSLFRSRLLGKISACVFFLAALAVVDGLQTLMRQDFNSVTIIPGETVILSGMMPQNASGLADLVVETQGLSGLTFTPVSSFKGFWMGGNMWRAELSASAAASPGKGTVTVVDMVPMKKVGQSAVRDEDSSRKAAPADTAQSSILGQNPALVYSVVIWPSAAERGAAELSFLRRYTGQPPFAVAGVAAVLALLFGLGNFFVFAKAEARLAGCGIYIIHGVKKRDNELHASFAHAGHSGFTPGDAVVLYDASWQEQGRGTIAGGDHIKGFARFSSDAPPRYGWLVALARAETRPSADRREPGAEPEAAKETRHPA